MYIYEEKLLTFRKETFTENSRTYFKSKWVI